MGDVEDTMAVRLTVNEISYLLKTWNSFYLIEHDCFLDSEMSENGMDISISPFRCEDIPQPVLEDLKDYTDDVFLEEDRFKINFLFSAWDHQPDMVLKALKPVLNLAEGSKVEIINYMDFIEKDLPEVEDEETEKDPTLLSSDPQKACSKYWRKEKDAEDTKEEPSSTPPKEELKNKGEVSPLHNEIRIEGVWKDDNLEVEKITHNGKEIDIPMLLEASRLYETIERNHTTPTSPTQTFPFKCSDENEAKLASLLMGMVTRYKIKTIDGAILNSNASGEELASIITYIRYGGKLKLFFNPYWRRVIKKRKEEIQETHKILQKSCSLFFFGFMALLLLIIWWLSRRGK